MARLISRGVVPKTTVQTTNEISTNTVANANQSYFIDTSASSVTLTLPPFPSPGDTIRVFDVVSNFHNNTCILARNGQPIMGGTDDLTIQTEGAAFEVVYSNSVSGWRIFVI